jgi:uncharacterized protein (DUF2267 family)
VELKVKNPIDCTLKTLEDPRCENPRIAATIANQIEATLHLNIFSANADPPETVHRISQMKNPRDMNRGANNAAMTPSTVDENTVTTIAWDELTSDEAQKRGGGRRRKEQMQCGTSE